MGRVCPLGLLVSMDGAALHRAVSPLCHIRCLLHAPFGEANSFRERLGPGCNLSTFRPRCDENFLIKYSTFYSFSSALPFHKAYLCKHIFPYYKSNTLMAKILDTKMSDSGCRSPLESLSEPTLDFVILRNEQGPPVCCVT